MLPLPDTQANIYGQKDTAEILGIRIFNPRLPEAGIEEAAGLHAHHFTYHRSAYVAHARGANIQQVIYLQLTCAL